MTARRRALILPQPGSELTMARFVRRLAVRSQIDEEERQALHALSGKIESIGPHEQIVRIGEHVDAAFLIIDGLVGRFSQARDGTRQITAVHIPGDMPDLHSVTLPPSASALVAIAPATVMRLPHSNFRKLLGKHPGLVEIFWRDCMVDAAIGAEWMLNLGRHDARTRIAHLFCEMAERYRLIGYGDGEKFKFPMNQTYMAEATGITAVHVNRVLRTLREDGILEVRGSSVTIIDRDALNRAGEFDPAYLMLDIAPRRLVNIYEVPQKVFAAS